MSADGPALLVVDKAIGSDQGLKYVYVVDGENKVQYRRVTTGPLQDNGLRVIAQGVEPGDRAALGEAIAGHDAGAGERLFQPRDQLYDIACDVHA